MTDPFLLKLIVELLEGDNPTKDEIGCAKKILKEMIEEMEKKPKLFNVPTEYEQVAKTLLDSEAETARKELLG